MDPVGAGAGYAVAFRAAFEEPRPDGRAQKTAEFGVERGVGAEDGAEVCNADVEFAPKRREPLLIRYMVSAERSFSRPQGSATRGQIMDCANVVAARWVPARFWAAGEMRNATRLAP